MLSTLSILATLPLLLTQSPEKTKAPPDWYGMCGHVLVMPEKVGETFHIGAWPPGGGKAVDIAGGGMAIDKVDAKEIVCRLHALELTPELTQKLIDANNYTLEKLNDAKLRSYYPWWQVAAIATGAVVLGFALGYAGGRI
jgi:hypothetical protein